jgi:hypothetical protein
MRSARDLTGHRFGKLTVMRLAEGRKWGSRLWHCACDCGGERITTGDMLRRGHTKSCGCLVGAPTHGRSNSAEYRSYTGAKGRCRTLTPCWHNYGGRGIEFRFESFEQFLAELAHLIQPDWNLS